MEVLCLEQHSKMDVSRRQIVFPLMYPSGISVSTSQSKFCLLDLQGVSVEILEVCCRMISWDTLEMMKLVICGTGLTTA